ncbi:ATP-binding protein [Sorangium sp. So ce362]|uniref:ATP-binding protein n=1 Tax=Sorangium sp. So ce362 TaxID=3133303 RepID=UPI003F606D85
MGSEFSELPPRASAVLHSLRAVGYDLPTAIADIIDNSLGASATHVRVTMQFDGASSHVRIEDNGCGMSAHVLEAAMRLGTHHPSVARASSDHGRFGLGLKTASFSQCRRLTVRARSLGGAQETRSWDLDHIENADVWALRHGAWDATSEARLGHVPENVSGTIVLWEKLDRVIEAPQRAKAHEDFDRKIGETIEHLSMVFHRLIDAKEDRLCLAVNGRQLQGWDPTLHRHRLTRQLHDAKLPVGGSMMHVVPYVIPPESRLSAEDARRAAGPHGWLAHQGFYLYRNRRLLVTGGWLGLTRRDPQCSLARIRLDVDNRLDDLLRIDIRKASARIPDQVRPRMQKIVEKTRLAAAEAWRDHSVSRRHLTARGEVHPVWLVDATLPSPRLRVNSVHPVVALLRGKLGNDDGFLDVFLALLGGSVPVDTLLQLGGDPSPSRQPSSQKSVPEELRSMTSEVVNLMKMHGMTAGDIENRLALVEPWSALPRSALQALLEQLP